MKQPLILHTPAELRQWRQNLKTNSQNFSVGFVPTMGALHQGHAELLKLARQQNDFIVLSIFVNPTQFNNPDDFKNYPITWEQDLKLAQQNGVDAIFVPNKNDLYPDDYAYKVTENNFSHQLCGAHRPGHFDGVLSIVLKLFMLTQANKAYFGEKDYQQLQLIKGMVDSFFLPIEIIPVPTVRESSGLALSSRNLRLNPQQKEKAVLISKLLKEKISTFEFKEQLESQGFKVDYVEDHSGRRFVAAEIGNVRLIDNAKI